jgi:D-xylonolactonase
MKHFMSDQSAARPSPQALPAVDAGDLCGECPVWDPADNRLYWTDCVGLKFQRFDPASAQHEVLKTGIEIYAFRPNRQGGFVVTNTAGVWTWDGKGELRLVANQAEGTRLQVNDCTADSAGRLLTGSFFYDPNAEYEPGRLVRICRDGTAAILDEGFDLPNGLGFSPDGRTLYFTDSVARRIYAYDYDVRDGSVRNRRLLVQVPRDEGIPDGLAVDEAGFVWSAQWYGGCVVRYDPDGTLERRIAVPAKQASSVAFGGAGLEDLFITTAAKSEPMPVMPPGYDPASGVIGGPLYHLRIGIRGLPQAPANIRVQG